MDPLSNIQTTTSAPPPYSTHAPPGNFISTISVGGRSSPPPARGHPTTWPEKGSAGTDDGSWSTSQATFAGTKNDSNMAVQAPVANSLAITSPPSPNPMYPPPNKPIPTVSVGGSYSPPSARGQPLPLPVWPERPDPAADVTGWRWIGIVIPAKETNPSQITGRVRKLFRIYVFTFSRPEVRKLFRIYFFTFSRPEVRKLFRIYVFTFSRPEVGKLFHISKA